MHLFLPRDSSQNTRESAGSLVFSTVPVAQANWWTVRAGVHDGPAAHWSTKKSLLFCKHLRNCFWPHFMTLVFSREEARVPERCKVGRLCFRWNHSDPAQRSSVGWWPSWGKHPFSWCLGTVFWFIKTCAEATVSLAYALLCSDAIFIVSNENKQISQHKFYR